MFFSGFASMSGTFRRAFGRTSAVAVVVAAAVATSIAVDAQARPNAGNAGNAASGDTLAAVQLAGLPPEAQETQRLILTGGPFPFSKDGSIFGNRERLLPMQPRGHYREYTVVTPQARNRGARRIICGGSQVRAPEVCYYTADHYSTFRRIER